MGEQRYKAVMAVLSGRRTVTEVARDWEASRQTMHAWLARYEREGMEGMGDRSHRPTRCPHQMPALVEVRVLEMRRHKPFWGPHRLALELGKRGVTPTPSASAIYRRLLRAGLIQPVPRRATGGLETLGAGRGDGAVAAGCGRRLSSRRWHDRQGLDRAGRPLEVLHRGSPDTSGTDQQGV